MIRILVADDHGVIREGLAGLLGDRSGLDVVATAADGVEAVARCRESQPDVVVLDLSMPGCSGREALRAIAEDCPNTRVLVLTMHDDAQEVRACLEAGASGYLAKHCAAGEIVQAIRDVHGGRSVVRVSADTAEEMRRAKRTVSQGAPPPSELSPREREVLELIAYGHTGREIAQELGLSPKSVDSYRERIYAKLGVRGRAQLVAYALEHGILRPSNPM